MKEGTDLYVDPEIYNINQIKDNATIRKDFVRMISDSFITKIDRTLILYGSTIHLDGRLRNYEA